MGSRNRTPTTPRRTDTADPAWSRERALRILFQADLRGVEPSVTLARVDGDAAARSLLDEHDCLADEEPILPVSAGPGGASDVASTRAGSPAGISGAGRREEDEPVRPSASGWSEVASTDVAALDGFTRSLVLGVEREREQVEALISRYARRWAISRMPVVDRNVLRLATYELLYEPTPPAVVLNEAIGLAKRLSTDDSGRFVNGVLESIRQEIVRSRAEASPDADDVG
jgi:N utilization substance protein B